MGLRRNPTRKIEKKRGVGPGGNQSGVRLIVTVAQGSRQESVGHVAGVQHKVKHGKSKGQL